MTEMTLNAAVQPKSSKLAMFVSFILALPLAGVLLIHPSLMLDANGDYSHRMMMLIMIGISGGFIHGVGFIPRFWLWRCLFSPWLAWPLMCLGYYTWLLT